MNQQLLYYACGVRWQERSGFLLWVDEPEPGREHLWADTGEKCPIFSTLIELRDFALQQGWRLANREAPHPADLDAVATWVGGAANRPLGECLSAWGLFDDLSAGTGQAFVGNKQSKARNRVFDLLYAESGPWKRPAEPVEWGARHLEKLRRILTQGLDLWESQTHWVK